MFKNLSVFFSFLFLFSASVSSQERITNDESKIYYSTGEGNTLNPRVTTVQPEQKTDAEKQELLKQLKTARLNNNRAEANRLLGILNKDNPAAEFVNDPLVTGMIETETGPQVPFTGEYDYQQSTISTAGCWAVATASSHRSRTIFAAVTEYINGGGDVMRIYASYNGGASWVLKNTFNGFVATVDYRPGELDIEPVISGSDTLLYCVAGYTGNSHALTQVYRVNIGTGTGSSTAWSFGGATNTNVNTYNPKITSDNTIFTDAYIYLTVSFDSAGTTRYTSRFAVIFNPFTASNLTFRTPSGSPSYGFYWHSNGTAPAYLHQDICYYNTGTDERIYTVYNHAGTAQGQRIYVAWSNDFGNTIAGNLTITETANVQGAVCAANGGSLLNIAIAYRRFFGPDWDFTLKHSINGGTTAGAFSTYTIEGTLDTTMTISIQEIDNGAGRFVTAHSRNGGEHFYRYFNNGSLGPEIRTNSAPGDVSFGGNRAGFWASPNPDSSLVVFSGGGGAGAYCSRLLNSTVGINGSGNEIPLKFSLGQNYPNPFNPATIISFNIPQPENVKLTVYDMLGKQVAVLIDKELNAGKYELTFDATTLSSGTYFYRLSAGSFTDIKKMVLIK